MPELQLVHLYPDLLRTYGDRGNVLALVRRAGWRNIPVRVANVTRGERLPKRCDFVFIGGGSDRVQVAVGPDLLARREQLADLVASGTVVLGVCGGYQLLGTAYRASTGAIVEGLGLLDIRTEAERDRLVGRVASRASSNGLRTTLIGFENHAGRTWLGPAASALARVRRGAGNNGVDKTEGAVQGRVLGTYLHGPVLALNPAFTDYLLGIALGFDLPPLNDEAERAARRAWQGAAGRLLRRRI